MSNGAKRASASGALPDRRIASRFVVPDCGFPGRVKYAAMTKMATINKTKLAVIQIHLRPL